MDKIIKIDGKEVKFRATARTPRLYRALVGRDMIADMNKLQKRFKKVDDGEQFDVLDLQIFEDTAYIMARHANPDMKEQTADEWLDTFDMFSIYEILPQIFELWAVNTKQTSTPKKK
ncbi:MAG: hypothetical protein IKU40_08755 [Clostridia bacterium]|nr:hypothetical protein [Clostridia bacterium]